MDSYVRRCTRAFSFLWSFLALVIVMFGSILGAVTEPAPDIFIIGFGVMTAVGAAAIGFMHGITLSAARRLDSDENEIELVPNALRCHDEYCTGVDCEYRHF